MGCTLQHVSHMIRPLLVIHKQSSITAWKSNLPWWLAHNLPRNASFSFNKCYCALTSCPADTLWVWSHSPGFFFFFQIRMDKIATAVDYKSSILPVPHRGTEQTENLMQCLYGYVSWNGEKSRKVKRRDKDTRRGKEMGGFELRSRPWYSCSNLSHLFAVLWILDRPSHCPASFQLLALFT